MSEQNSTAPQGTADTPRGRLIVLVGPSAVGKSTVVKRVRERLPELFFSVSVTTRAARALEAGADGVIASPREAALIRALPEAAGRLIVTPGVRPAGSDAGDQKRIETPATAIANGADHIVVGRPIWQAADPRAAALAIAAEFPRA